MDDSWRFMKQLYSLFFHPHPQFYPHLQPLFNLNLNLNLKSRIVFSWILTCWIPRPQQYMRRSRYQTMLFEVLIQMLTSHFGHFRMEWYFQNYCTSAWITNFFIISGFEELPIINDPNWTLLHQAKCLGRYFQYCRYWFIICSLHLSPNGAI